MRQIMNNNDKIPDNPGTFAVKQGDAKGLRQSEAHHGPQSVLPGCILSIVLFTGLFRSFLSMLEWQFAFAVPSGLAGLTDGFRLIANRLFAISEERQLYRYIMFSVNSPEAAWAGNINAALFVVLVLFAVVSGVLVFCRKRAVVIAVMVFVAAVQVYFGVFPGAGWNIVLFGGLGILLVCRGDVIRVGIKRGGVRCVSIGDSDSSRAGTGFVGTNRGKSNIVYYVIFIAIVTIVAAAVWFVYPEQNPQLHTLSEAIRDRFSTRVAIVYGENQRPGWQTQSPDYLALNVVYVQEETLHQSSLDDFQADREGRAQGAEIGFAMPPLSLIPVLIILCAIIALALAARLIPNLVRGARRRKMFGLDESTVAINNMFVYMLEWLWVYGLRRDNVVFSAYGSDLAGLISPQYSQEYEGAAALWREAVYSNHAMDEGKRQYMMAFLDKTRTIVWKNSDMRAKLRIKFSHFL